MNRFFKFISFVLMTTFIFCIAGCSKGEYTVPETETEVVLPPVIRVGAQKGVALGVLKLMEDSENNNTRLKYEFSSDANISVLMESYINGEYDVLIVPANVAAKLYNFDKNCMAVAINSLESYSLFTNNFNIESIADIKNETINYLSNPVLNSYLSISNCNSNKKNGYELLINDDKESYLSEDNFYSILPGISSSMAGITGYGNRRKEKPEFGMDVKEIDVTNEITSALNGIELIQSVILVHKNFIEKYSDSINIIMDDISDSINYLKNTKNLDKCVQLGLEFGAIINKDVLEDAIINSKYKLIRGLSFKVKYRNYLEMLVLTDIGGMIPGDDFFYVK